MMDEKGERKYSIVDPNTYATLTEIVSTNETTLLRSELHIQSNQSLSSTVSCQNVNAESKQSINFTVLGDGMCNKIHQIEIIL